MEKNALFLKKSVHFFRKICSKSIPYSSFLYSIFEFAYVVKIPVARICIPYSSFIPLSSIPYSSLYCIYHVFTNIDFFFFFGFWKIQVTFYWPKFLAISKKIFLKPMLKNISCVWAKFCLCRDACLPLKPLYRVFLLGFQT